jgi:hypothetical protein
MDRENLVGICGRQNAGKSSISSYLTGQNEPQYQMIPVDDPFKYVVDVIFGTVPDGVSVSIWRDPIWNLTRYEQENMMRNMIENFVDSNWFKKNPVGNLYMVPVDSLENDQKWVEMSFAWSLKKICSVIFGVSFEMLLGLTPSAREERENITFGHLFDRVPTIPFTGRVILEYFGTDVMRNRFDPDIWLNIMRRDAERLIQQGVRIVVPDVRFENEFRFLNKVGAALLVVYREDKDLVLTEDDKKTHVAKWHFLKYYPEVKKHILLKNDKTLNHLYEAVNAWIK